jgi:hypothetical protein
LPKFTYYKTQKTKYKSSSNDQITMEIITKKWRKCQESGSKEKRRLKREGGKGIKISRGKM